MRRSVVFVSISLLGLAACTEESYRPSAAAPTATAAMETLDGSWSATEMTVNGVPVEPHVLRATSLMIDGSRIRIEGIQGMIQTGSIEYHDDRTPRGIVVTIDSPAEQAGATIRMIYDLHRDSATFVQRLDGAWPEDFSVEEGSEELKVVGSRLPR